MLAILTFGAVSASDDANNLTAVDDAVVTSTDDVAETVSQVEEVDVIAEDDSDVSEVLGEKSDMGYDINCKDEIAGPAFDGEWDDYNGYIGISLYDSSEANMKIFLDNEEVASFPAYEFYGDFYSHRVVLNNYDLSIGTHSARFVFDGDDYYNPFDITKEFEYYYIKDYTPSEIKIGSWDTFCVSLAKDAGGTLKLLIDGNEVFSASTDGLREEYAENPSIRIRWEDMNLESDLEFGPHSYELRYSDGKYDNKTFTGNFNLDYQFNVENDYLYEGNPVTYGHSIAFDVYLPDDASVENITLIANDKQYSVEVDSNYVFVFNDLVYGKNNLTFIYQDDKYPKKNVTWIFDTVGRINVPYEIAFNDGQTIELVLPSDAQGNLEIYHAIEDEWGDLTIDDLIKSTSLNNGIANVSLNDFKFGRYNIIVKYTGEYDVSQVSQEIVVGPDVVYKKYYWVDGENNLTVNSPEGLSGKFNISIVYNFYDDEYNWQSLVIPLYEGPASEKLNITLPKLNITSYGYYGDGDGSQYYFNVKYIEDDEELFENNYYFDVKAEVPVWEMDVDFPNTAVKGEDIEWQILNIPRALYSGYVIVYIDDTPVSRANYDYEDLGFDDTNYISSDVLNALDQGSHTWKLVFVDRNDYYENATQNGTFEISWIAIPSEITLGEYNIYFETDEDATGYLTLIVDGNEYSTEFVQDGSAIIDLDDLTLGEHTYEITYSGDKNHEKLTKTGTFTVKMSFDISIDDDDVLPLMERYVIDVDLPDDATGNVLINIGGNNYTSEVINGSAKVIVTGLSEGEHVIVAKYSGDSKYPSQEITRSFEIEGYRIIVEYDEDDIPTSFTLLLPSDADGWLIVSNELEYSEYKRAPIEEGKVKILVSDLGLSYGVYPLEIRYEQEDYKYDVSHEHVSLELKPKVDIIEDVLIGESSKVDIDVGDAEGSIIIKINDEVFSTEEIKDGKVSVSIPSDKLNLGENIVTLEYQGDDLPENSFSEYDGEVDDYVPTKYYVYVTPKDLTIPDDFAADGSGNITLELPEGSSGNVNVYVDGELVSTTPVAGGTNTVPVSGLPTGNHNVRVEYEDENGQTYSTSNEVNVPKPEPKMDIATPTDSTNPEFSISLPEDATGSLIVTVDGKSYTADLVNGKATVSVPGLEDGNHNVTVKYTGDKNYAGFTKNTNVVVNTTPKKEDTKPAPAPAKKADKITLKLKKVKKVKRSAKKLVIKATLKINGKAVKGKKLKFKFNKKTYTAKTNKKGVAKITVKKKVLKKLKAGKKVKIQVSYGKKTDKQKVKVKK
jgi:hypothetical protein